MKRKKKVRVNKGKRVKEERKRQREGRKRSKVGEGVREKGRKYEIVEIYHSIDIKCKLPRK